MRATGLEWSSEEELERQTEAMKFWYEKSIADESWGSYRVWRKKYLELLLERNRRKCSKSF